MQHPHPPGRLLALCALVAAACSEASATSNDPASQPQEVAQAPPAEAAAQPGVPATPAAFVAGDVGAQDPPKPKRVPKPGRQGAGPQGGEKPAGGKPGDDHAGDHAGDHADDHAGDHGGDGTAQSPRGGGKVPGGSPFAGEKDTKAKLKIEFGTEKHSFGSCRQGDLLEHTFELVSDGENPVKIRQASPTCGCTVTGVLVEGEDGEPVEYKMGDPIAPGKKVFISSKLDTTNKKNKTQVRVNVYTNDPIGLTQLVLAADIEPFISVTPPFVNVGDIKEGETKTQAIDIRTARGEPIGLELDPGNPIKVPEGMDIELAPINPGQDGRAGHWRAMITIGPGAKEGSIGYSLRLKSDVQMPDAVHKIEQGNPSFYTASASINGRILGALSFTPQFVSLGLVRPGQRVPRNVKVISHDPDFDLSGVTIELQGEQGQELAWSEYFTTSVKPATGLASAVDVQLRLEGLPDGAEGSFRGVMVIKTGHPKKPELAVRFSGVCRSGVKTPTPPGGGE